jgi:nucleotide-binding universal stress UspA family protein
VARRQLAGRRVLEAARGIVAGVPVEVEEDLLEGPAADAILSAAESRKADLIVMGTRGMGSLKGTVFGSVSTKVSHYAPCTVMVVR